MLTSLRMNPERQASNVSIAADWPRILILSIMCCILALAAGNRWIGWGRDYEQYFLAYDTISPSFLYGSTRFEIGYETLGWIFAVPLRASFATFYTVLAFIAILLKFYMFYRYLKAPLLAACVYLLLFYPIYEYTEIRAAVAISFGYYGLHLAYIKRYYSSIILLIIAFLFHSSAIFLAILGLGIIVLPMRVVSTALPIGVISIFFISSVMRQSVAAVLTALNPLVLNYLENSNASESINVLSLSNLLFMITAGTAVVLGSPNRANYSRNFLYLTAFGLAAVLIFRSSPVIALRISEMLLFSSIFFSFSEEDPLAAVALRSLMLINGAWFTYRAFVEGTLG